MIKSMASPNDLWHLRKHMTTSLAAFIFMTYTMSMADRRPARVHISRATGKLYTSDMVPCESQSFLLLPRYGCSRLSRCSNRPWQARTRPQRAGTVPLHAEHAALHRTARRRGPSDELAHRHRWRPHRVRVRPRASPLHLRPRRDQYVRRSIEQVRQCGSFADQDRLTAGSR